MEWISVKDRLPDEGTKVLSFSHEIKIDYIIYAPDPIWACRLERDESKVTYWMPLPEQPKE